MRRTRSQAAMHSWRTLISASAGSVSSSLAVFLLAGLAVQVRETMDLSVRGLGLAVSGFYLAAAVASIPTGRVAESWGGVRSVRVSAATAALSLALVGVAARSLWSLALILCMAGVANAAMQTSTNLLLMREVPPTRRGAAFGLKQASVPFSATLGGLAVPVLGLTIGWRWAFILGAVIAALVAVAIPRQRATADAGTAGRKPGPEGRIRKLPLVVLALGFGLAMLATTSLTTFLVISSVEAGFSKSGAGLLVMVAGLSAVTVRVTTGLGVDKWVRDHLVWVAGLLAGGVVGYVSLAVGTGRHLEPLMAFGAVVAYGSGWGWNGLFNLAVSVTHAQAPALATGVTLTANRTAGVFGPSLFALIVAEGSYTIAWLSSAVCALVGAGVILIARSMLKRRDGAGTKGHPMTEPVHATQPTQPTTRPHRGGHENVVTRQIFRVQRQPLVQREQRGETWTAC